MQTTSATIGDLDEREIESLLHEELIGRLGYVDRRGQPYIVPIAYAYDGHAFYGYSPDGAKLEGMRQHPQVCIEVDRVRHAADWESVVACGRFEELRGDVALDAVRRISERLTTTASAEGQPDPARRSYVARLGAPGIAYRIRVDHKSGRFARST
ncbi:MAG: pyridoxamine 5'-phosphate oxidase family protein [Candidatus Elarobacter sp.]